MVRRDALTGLKELSQTHPTSLQSSLDTLIRRLSTVFLDSEETVRHAAHLLLKSLLPALSVGQLAPFSGLLFTSVACGLTHINPSVQLDTLKNTSLLLVHCPSLVRENADQLLPLYLPLISRATSSSSKGKAAQLNVVPESVLSMQSSLVDVFKQLLEFMSIVGEADRDDDLRPSIVIDPCKEQVWTSLGNLPLTEPVNLLEYLSTSTLLLHLNPRHMPPNLLGRGGVVSSSSKGRPLSIGRETFDVFVEQVLPILLEFWLEIVPMVAVQPPARKYSRGVRRKADATCEKLQLVLDLLFVVLRLSLRRNRSSGTELCWTISRDWLSSLEKHLLAYFPIRLNPNSERSSSSALALNLHLCQLMLLAHASYSSSMLGSLAPYDGSRLEAVVGYLVPRLPKCSTAFAGSAQFADFVGGLVLSLDGVLLSPLLSRLPQEGVLTPLFSAVARLFSSCHPLSSAKHCLLAFLDELVMRNIAHPSSVR